MPHVRLCHRTIFAIVAGVSQEIELINLFGIDIRQSGGKRGKAPIDALITPPTMRLQPRYLVHMTAAHRTCTQIPVARLSKSCSNLGLSLPQEGAVDPDLIAEKLRKKRRQAVYDPWVSTACGA
jgi:hypothetical protein